MIAVCVVCIEQDEVCQFLMSLDCYVFTIVKTGVFVLEYITQLIG